MNLKQCCKMNIFVGMLDKVYYMNRCIELAQKAIGYTSPNPRVGAVIVAEGRIIGEGYHRCCGEPHAEVNAIASVKKEDLHLLQQATLFVNLEPCSHYGKTPPCADLIIEKKIPHVVVGSLDPFPEVSGRGIKRLRGAGVFVETNVCGKECDELNKRFFTFYKKKRPYIFLKWAQSTDGFMGRQGERIIFSTKKTLSLVHQMRHNEDAILVGTNTAIEDNPSLTCRLVEGKNPIRLLLDRNLRIPFTHHLYDGSCRTVIFTEKPLPSTKNIEFQRLDFSKNILNQIMQYCYENKIMSLIVEGGATLLDSFLYEGLYDEVRVEVSPIKLGDGIRAPMLDFVFTEEIIEHFDNNSIIFYRKKNA